MNLPPAAIKSGDVEYIAPCPAGHDAMWFGNWIRTGGAQRDVEMLDFHCPVCDAERR